MKSPLTTIRPIIEYLFDATIALLLLIPSLPICLWIAWKLRRNGTKPILFIQTRIGQGGKHFKIIKFRTMYLEATKNGPFICTSYNDPRITEFGKFLRSKKLDELPQLINILLGNMRFVGPRPEIPFYHLQNSKNIPNWVRRVEVKPGITGFAQIHPTVSHDPSQKIVEDIRYIDNRSLLVDIKIMLATALGWVKGRIG